MTASMVMLGASPRSTGLVALDALADGVRRPACPPTAASTSSSTAGPWRPVPGRVPRRHVRGLGGAVAVARRWVDDGGDRWDGGTRPCSPAAPW